MLALLALAAKVALIPVTVNIFLHYKEKIDELITGV